jgi:proteasome lid subunit RPN8/RPN11
MSAAWREAGIAGGGSGRAQARMAAAVGDPDHWGIALEEALRHAVAAYPLEAAGLLFCPSAGGAPQAEPWLHAVSSSSHFSLERYQDVARLEALSASGAEIAVYHSHPDGAAVWSATDASGWTTPLGPSWPVAHLVIAVRAGAAIEVAAYRWSEEAHAFVERWRWVPSETSAP